MKARIRKKGLNRDKTTIYLLEYIRDGDFNAITLNPEKLADILDRLKKDKIAKKNKEKKDAKNL